MFANFSLNGERFTIADMHILLTNDDGIYAVGLRALYAAFVGAGHEVAVVAPMAEQSAVGHSITVFTPLRVRKVREPEFEGLGVFGTPADCVKLALSTLLERKPDCLVSGINSGANVGVDIVYSGTVSAATEGALNGIPAMAVSFDDFHPVDLSAQAKWVRDFLEQGLLSHFCAHTVCNVNFPRVSKGIGKGLRVCRQTSVAYQDGYEQCRDPRDQPYYWLTGEIPKEQVGADADRALLSDGYITMTPLHFDFTHWKSLKSIEAQMELFQKD